MILTLTPNPSLDLLFQVGRLVWDDANRTAPPRRRAGGQGINLVRAARAIDPAADTLAIAPLGGGVGRELRELLEAEGTPIAAIPVPGETRVFVGARERESGRSLLLNPRGSTPDAELGDRLLAAVEDALKDDPGWVACCGSLLPGLPLELYAEVGRVARRYGARFVPDCDGEALALAAPFADLLVPNDMEAARLVGRPVGDAGEAAAAGRTLLDQGRPRVVITMGDRGAVSVTAAGAWWAYPALPATLAEETREGSAVGAGDAFLAALLVGAGEGDAEALLEAVATGTAALLGRGADLVWAADVDRVRPHVRVERLPG